jgi:hypothetical protein
MDDFSKYEQLKAASASPEAVYRAGKADGMDQMTLLRMLRKLFSLSPRDAKAVWVRAEGLADSLEAHQKKFLPAVEQLLGEQRQVSPTPRANMEETGKRSDLVVD